MNATSITRSRTACGATTAFLLALCAPALSAQALHTNDRWKNCSFVIDPALTQGAWHEFVSEIGPAMYLRPLDTAEPLGKGRLEIAALGSATRIDQTKSAWNDTFSHPDADHPLSEGNALKIPGLMVRGGVTDRVDVAAYATKSINANYGIVGAQVQYNLLNDATRNLAAAVRATGVRLVGPEDLSASVYGADLLVSKTIGFVSPYAGVSGHLSRGQEHTAKVTLANENVLGAEGTLGVAAKFSVLTLGAEYHAAKVSGYAVKISVRSR
jgi:hypothetical protein